MKDIYDLLNYVEVDLEEYDETQLNDLERKKIKKKLQHSIKNKRYNFRRIIKYVAISLAILTLIGIATFKANPTFARTIPLIGTLIKNSYGYNTNEFDKYTSVINKTIEKNGLKVTLDEVVLDDNSLIIASTFKNNEKLPKSSLPATMSLQLFINGKLINVSGGGGGSQFIDDYTYVAVNKLDVHNIKIPNNVNIKIVYENFVIYQKNQKDFKTINGPWEFEFNVSKNEIQNKTNTIKINKNLKFKDIDMDIKNITITPISTTIFFDFKRDMPVDSMCDPLYFIITDDKGRYLRYTGGYFLPNKDKINYDNKETPSFLSFSAVPSDSRKLYITPYYDSFNSKPTEPMLYSDDLPIILKQNNESKITISNVQRKNGKIYVDYRAEGICFGIPGNLLYLYDDNKKELDIEDVGNSRKIDNNKDIITKIFKDRNGGNIYVGTLNMKDVIILKDSKFTIDLKK